MEQRSGPSAKSEISPMSPVDGAVGIETADLPGHLPFVASESVGSRRAMRTKMIDQECTETRTTQSGARRRFALAAFVVVLGAAALAGCGDSSSSNESATTTSIATTTSVASPPCTEAAIQAALPANKTIMETGGLGLHCEGGYAGVSTITEPIGLGGVQLFQASGSVWVAIERTAATCAAVPASIAEYCNVS